VDTDPERAIPELEATLERLPLADASIFAQHFVVGLLGDRFGSGTRAVAFRNARDLKTLYILMHRFIRTADDVERAGKGVYTPELRDDAQEARAKLFNMLAAVPGAEAYAAIKLLEDEHPEPDYRRWMARRAHERATIDADEPPWTDTKVSAFVKDISVIECHRQDMAGFVISDDKLNGLDGQATSSCPFVKVGTIKKVLFFIA
jgi:hypothetical protein